MTWIPLLTDHLALRTARSLCDEQRFDEALLGLAGFSNERALSLNDHIRSEAVDHWCQAAARADGRGDASVARRRLERARRYATSDLIGRVHEADRRFRIAMLKQTRAEHWLPLFEPVVKADFAELIDDRVLQLTELAWGNAPTVEAVEEAADDLLRLARPAVASRFPVALHPRNGVDSPFVQAVLFCALGRPDIAVLPLMSADDREPLVLFLLARVAQALGHPRIAQIALRDFEARAGGHHRIQRLHSGVFLAQMALACDDAQQALAVFRSLPVALLGGRPALIYARLLIDHGQREEAVALIDGLKERHPNLEGIGPLSDEADGIVVTVG